MSSNRQPAGSISVPPSDVRNSAWIAAMPFIFVLIWSSGFVVAKYGLPYAPPLTFLLLRFIGVIAVLLPLVILMRAPWPVGVIRHIAVAGLLVQAGYLAGVWSAISVGMPAGLAALIVGLQPILTAIVAPAVVGERVSGRQWLGLVFGLCGVALVVSNKISLIGLSWESIAFTLFALVSITVGMLYQKKYCPDFDLRTGTIVQFVAAALAILPFAIAFEDLTPTFDTVQWTADFIGAFIWAVFGISIGGIFLLFALIRKSAATQVTSLLYLTPPTTAVMAWLMFGEVFSMIGIVGMALAVVGVALVVRK